MVPDLSFQDTVSVHRPSFYADRFLKFMNSRVFKKIQGKIFMNFFFFFTFSTYWLVSLCKIFIYLFFNCQNSFFLKILLHNIVLVLPYIDLNPPWVYMCSPSWTPLQPPSPSHPSGSSQHTSPEHPVSCIKPRLAIHFTYDNLHVSMPFSHISLPSPSPTESKRLFGTSVSLFLSHIQGYHYHHSKFRIYALVYCIGVFLSGLLHSV